jgi:hypothetical protein
MTPAFLDRACVDPPMSPTGLVRKVTETWFRPRRRSYAPLKALNRRSRTPKERLRKNEAKMTEITGKAGKLDAVAFEVIRLGYQRRGAA